MLEESYIMRVIVTAFRGSAGAARKQAENPIHNASQPYDNECAWRDARPAHLDAWIRAASQNLDDVIASLLTAIAGSTISPATGVNQR